MVFIDGYQEDFSLEVEDCFTLTYDKNGMPIEEVDSAQLKRTLNLMARWIEVHDLKERE